MTTPLKRAQDGLQFDDIFQQAVNCWLAEDFEPRIAAPDFQIQRKHHVTQSDLLTFTEDTPENTVQAQIFRVRIDTGVRLINGQESGDEVSPCAQIEAIYHVDYRVTDSNLIKDQEALDAFALENASFHLWPYWREYVMSQAQRMNLPKIPLPMRERKPLVEHQKQPEA